MNRGYVKLWRKSVDSPVFANDGIWKLWCLCLMKASHSGQTFMMGVKPVTLSPGQFVTGRYALWEEYHQWHLIKRKPRRKPAPSAITVHRWLLTLQEMQMLYTKSTNKYSIITICNWDRYQQDEQQVNNKRTTDDHIQECINTPEKILELKKRYSDQEIINRAFDAIASTRKSNKVADTVLLAQLKKWEKYPTNQVEGGIRVYLKRDYAGQGKREEYLLGIIRNNGEVKKPAKGQYSLDDEFDPI